MSSEPTCSPAAGRACTKCRRDLPAEAFRPNPRLASGLHSWCKDCTRDAVQRSRAKAGARGRHGRRNRGRAAERRQERPDVERLQSRHTEAMRRARAAGALGATSPSRADLARLLRETTVCPLCHVAMTAEVGEAQAQIDHMVPLAAGGTHDLSNLRVICCRCNRSRPEDGSDLELP